MIHDIYEKDTLSNYLKQVQLQFDERPAQVIFFNFEEKRASIEEALSPMGHYVRFRQTDSIAEMENEEQPDLLIHNIHNIEQLDDAFLAYLKRCYEARVPTVVILPEPNTDLQKQLIAQNVDAVIEPPYSEADLLCRIRNLIRIRRLQQWSDMLLRQLTDLLQRRTHDLIDEERQTVIDNLINGIFHNIRGPLTGLFFACDTLSLSVQDLAGGPAGLTSQAEIADLDGSVNMIRKAVERMNDMLCKLLERSEADSRAYPQVIDLNLLVTQEIELMKADMEFKHQIHKTIELHPEPIEIKAVRSEISQSIFSILRNAVEALAGHESPQIEIRTDITDNMANIYIADNGPGIAPETRERIFEPFFSTKPKPPADTIGAAVSKGLGLHFCRQSIRANRGEIILVSEPGKRTCFRIKLPLHKEP